MKTTSPITVRIPQGPNSYALIVRPGEFFSPVTSAGIRSGDILVAGADNLRIVGRVLRIVGRVTAVATLDGAQVVELEAVAPNCVIDSFGATLGDALPDECNTGVASSGLLYTVAGDNSGGDVSVTIPSETSNLRPAVPGAQTTNQADKTMNIIKNDPFSAPATARSYMRQCKMALQYIEDEFRAKPAIERYAFARKITAYYLRLRRRHITLDDWRRQRMRHLAKSMRGN